MMISAVLLVALQLCSLQLIVVSRPTCRMQGDLVKCAHDRLKELGEDFPVHCVPYNANISFPRSAFNLLQPCDRVLSLVNESLWGAGKMFGDAEEPLPVNWDEKRIERFQGLQDRIVGEESCFSSGSNILTTYFSNLMAVLEQQESAACGWMALRRDLLRFLKFALEKHHTCFIWRSARSNRL